VWASATAGHPGAYLVVQNDGNLVIYDPQGKALWAYSRLNPGQTLLPGTSIPSLDGRFRLTLQADGNLVLYWTGSADTWPKWASNTAGQPVSQAAMQADGNFVLYGPAGPLWASATAGDPGAYLVVQNDADVVIYSPGGPVWATGAWSPIDAKYLMLGGPRGYLGPPASAEQDSPNGGRFRDFGGGSIYWSPQVNAAYEVTGPIRAKYISVGGPGGFLQYPTGDESPAGDFDRARVCSFQGGPIFWTLETGAHEMHDVTIYDKWIDMSDSLIPGRSVLGWPTSDVYVSGTSFRQDFQAGYIIDVNDQATSYCQSQGTGCDQIIGGPPPVTGVREVDFYNCNADMRVVYIWSRDLTASGSWQNLGDLPAQYDAQGDCPGDAMPLTVSLQDGHEYELAAVDPEGVTCNGHNDPSVVGCRRWYAVATGSSQGQVIPVTIS
jgi:hypothetical protein